MKKLPRLSVIMPVYNCEKYVQAAIESILKQTYKNLELIICDDGSTDQTYSVCAKIATKNPRKIILLRNQTNLKMNKTLNKCLAKATGEYIGRMDGDDLCSPERFAIEMDFLENHREYSIVSCAMDLFDENGKWGRERFPVGDIPPSLLVHQSPFCHGGCLVRREAFDAVGGYATDPRTVRVEDYDLWVRMYASGFRGYGLKRSLYLMRSDRQAISRRNFRNYINNARIKRNAIRLLGLPKKYYLTAALRPFFVMLLPKSIYRYLHRRKYGLPK